MEPLEKKILLTNDCLYRSSQYNLTTTTGKINFAASQELVEEAVKRDGDSLPAALAAVAVWVRFSAARHLTWNRNYNVKPREISAAQVTHAVRAAVRVQVQPFQVGAERVSEC